MSHWRVARTASTDPSLIDMTNRKPFSISTTVWFTLPPPKYLAAPWVRLDSPEATAASWSAVARSRSSERAMSRPSAETTIVWMTPGTFLTKFWTSQFRFCASLLSCAIVAPGPHCGGVVIGGDESPAPGVLPAALEAVTVARQPAAHAGGRALGGARPGPGRDVRPRGGAEAGSRHPAGQAGAGPRG